MSHRQENYKQRGRRGGGILPRLGLPVRSNADYHRGRGGQFQRGRGVDRGRRFNNRYPDNGSTFQQRPIDRVRQKPWFKITIIRGADYGKEHIMKALSSYLDCPLWPVLYKTNDDGSVTFLVDDKDVADSVGAASRRVQAPNGQKMNIRVTDAPSPYVKLEPSYEESVKTALQHRYDAINNHLDLSAFSFDAAFQEERGTNLSLQRNNVMMAVVDLLGKEQTVANSIRSIDISQNRLRFMDYFACLVPRLPNVTRLILHHNQLDSLGELEKLSGWNLTELDLDETPLCGRYRNKTSYINDIRRIFKKLMKLDGTDLPPETKFALDHPDQNDETNTSLPPFKPSFFVDDNIKSLTLKFLELYFTIFDDEDPQKRQKLLEAYDDDATFTMSAMNLTLEAHNRRGDNWKDITRDSHNILKMEIWERFRAKLVQKGKLAVLSYLCNNFPATAHVAESFVVDISFASGNVLCANVSGVYREQSVDKASQDSNPMRLFNRVYLLVQNEKGLCIVNEMLFVSTLTLDQYAAYMRQVERANASTVQNVAPVPALIDALPGPSAVAVDAKSALLEQFMKETGMKLDWARKCLDDYEYDYPKAALAFSQLKQGGAIPAEAFQ